MDLKEQKYVCTLAECKSLTRASERLYISQPALSHRLSALEEELGTELIIIFVADIADVLQNLINLVRMAFRQ